MNSHKLKTELIEPTDMGWKIEQENGAWYAYASMPWNGGRYGVVCKNGEPIPCKSADKATIIAQAAVIGQWQDKTTGTRDGIDAKAVKEIKEVFG